MPRARPRGLLREVILMGPEQSRIIVGRPIGRELAALDQLAGQLAGSGAAVLALGLAGGWWLSRRAVRPIERMSQTAASISATNLSQRINLADVDHELVQLGQVLNAMFERLQTAFEQQARFTADASHELRTPLSVLLSHAELALARPRSAEEYRSTIETCPRASRRMKSLVDDLLTLARADAGRLELKSQAVDLCQLVEECAALLEPLARQREVSLTHGGQPTAALGDPDRLAQVVTNLLSNAILYNRPGGRVTCTTTVEGNDAVLTVVDSGMGIAEADRLHIFDRFYRVDPARSCESGGSGLGLAICKSIVAAHGGSIAVTSEVQVGTAFTVRLPRSQTPDLRRGPAE